MSEGRELLIEQTILDKVKTLLSVRVNDLLAELRYSIPAIEFSSYVGAETVCPSIVLSLCERTEKERLIFLDAYSLTIAFNLPETPESEMDCYTYAAAVEKKAIREDKTLGGVVDRIVLTGKKYSPPKKPHCGEGWGVVVSLRITVEEMRV